MVEAEIVSNTGAETQKLVFLAAGGTGGHLFPALALAEQLEARGLRVALVTDKRVDEWAGAFSGTIHTLTAGTVTRTRFIDKAMGALRLLIGTWQAYRLFKRERPRAVIGFGGYPTVPPVLAAILMRIPTIIHEANAVMGRANRFLAPRVEMIATGFPMVSPAFPEKTLVVGNPVRRPVRALAGVDYDPPQVDGMIRLLVFGGSQGARVMSDVVPGALEKLPPALLARLHITQQAREEDLIRVTGFYDKLGIAHEVAAFFADMPARMAAAHLVIARSGAMTVSELAVIGRPAILVPLPGSLDQDQAANGAMLARADGALVVPQAAFTPVSLAEMLERILTNPERLARMAEGAKSIGVADASAAFADQVLSMLDAR